MWKSILFRRPLKQRKDDRTGNAQSQRVGTTPPHPFADLMAKLDKIPYQRRLKRA
jgi:hypothetical protein